MKLRCEEAEELITGLVDGELSQTDRLDIEGHLEECQRCRLTYRLEADLKRSVRAAGARLKAPAALRERILSGPRNQGPEFLKGWGDLFRPVRLSPAFVFAAVILMALPIFYVYMNAVSSVPLATLETHSRIVEGTIPVVRGKTPKEIREYLFHSVQGRFAPMALDLSRANLQAVGGTVRTLYGRKVLVTVYEGVALSLTCYTFFGAEEDAPPDSRVFFDPEKRINFYTFSRDGLNAVLHRAGERICVLVSTIPVEDLLEIARANARTSQI